MTPENTPPSTEPAAESVPCIESAESILEEAPPEASSSLTTTLNEIHEEMTASTAEWRRGSRRQMEVLKEFGTALNSMGQILRDLHQESRQNATTTPSPQTLPDDWLHVLIDLHDRLSRTADAMLTPPAGTASIWPAARAGLRAWDQAWRTQAEANTILLAHLRTLLQRAGLQPIPALGQPFDPAQMNAVEVITDPSLPDHHVTAELLSGWLHTLTARLLRPAQVRVSRRQPVQ